MPFVSSVFAAFFVSLAALYRSAPRILRHAVPIQRARKACFLPVYALSLCCAYAAKAPGWYTNHEAAYPPSGYIAAVGEGASEGEARESAVAQISLYFHTSTEVCNELIRKYNEADGKKYAFSTETESVEQARIRSEAEFFGIQFTDAYAVKKKVYVLAFINRDDAFEVYAHDIRQNEAVLEHLLEYAEDPANPVVGLDAARRACAVAGITAELVKNARTVKNVGKAHFARVDQLVDRSYTALRTCRENLVFSLEVENDYNSSIYTVLAELLEDSGYTVATNGGGRTALDVRITADEDEKPAGTFVYCAIKITGAGSDGKPYFSYSRIMPKKGAPRREDAYRRAYLALAEELRRSFIGEFSTRIQITYE